MKLLLVGATGLVGSHVLELALSDIRISKIVVLTRSAITLDSTTNPKLEINQIDFDDLPQSANWWQVDSVICTLGTTMRKAKTKAQFRRVDYDYPLAIATIARQHNASSFVLNSSMGANISSRFYYNQVKGDVEAVLAQLDYPSLTIVRPGLIKGDRKEKRFGEQIMVGILKIFGVILPKKMQLNPARNIAQNMIEAALQQQQGINIIRSDKLI
ncbi:MAG: NAD(P)H-binding protein [Pseudomonadota bacterium]|nr:NAD(P)H-binding protein [Pseudomonadota bacterium]MDO7710496.1 NAD(P)H-binding protein [Pseudomonadota bacterium]